MLQLLAMSSVASQEQRLRVLAEIVREPDASVLDFGCGTGHLCEVLRRDFGFRGRYTGYDLSGETLALARAHHPGAHFEQRDIFRDGVGHHFDYAVISGVFNNRVADNWAFLTGALRVLFPHVRRGLAFNALSAYVDFQDPALYYADPDFSSFRPRKPHVQYPPGARFHPHRAVDRGGDHWNSRGHRNSKVPEHQGEGLRVVTEE